jgi:DNA repair protein SbcD/Mre11
LPYRLLHIADLHLDRAFAAMGCQGELARRRRRGLRDALRLAGEVALERHCDALTIGGDLYEHERAGVDTARFLAETFAAWRPLRVLIAPGNHDALLPGCVYRRADWPDNVTVFQEPRLVPVSLQDGLTLWGLAHREPEWRGNPLAVPERPREGVHLALFHGAELGSRPEGKSIHGPFLAGEIRERGFTAALCGHYHRRRLDESGGLLYPGSPEPLTFDEQGGRGPVLVELGSEGGVRFQALTTNRWSVVCLACNVEACPSQEAVLDAIATAWEREPAAVDPERALVRVDLSGAIRSTLSLDCYTIESVGRERLGCALLKVRDLTTAEHDVAAALSERGTRGAFARAAVSAREAADEAEAAVLEDALRYGLSALSGREVGLR